MKTISNKLVFLDCTLRDGGYYNAWDFSPGLIQDYIDAMVAAGVDVVELGFRSLKVLKVPPLTRRMSFLGVSLFLQH